MTLRQLEILRATIRCQTTMAAARELGMSQPAVSSAIRHMEGQLGFPLFERVNNRLFPTDAARVLQEDAEPLFAMHAALELKLQDLREDKVSRLRILSTPPLGHAAIPAALELFLRRHPRLRIFFDVRELDEVVRSVESGTTDLGFGLGLGHHQSLQVQPLFTGRMVCVTRRDHPLARLPAVTPRDLAEHPFIALEAGTRMGIAVRDAFLAARQPFAFRAEVRYCDTACVLAAAGLGVSVVDPFSPTRDRGLAVRPFAPAIPSVAYAFWSARRPISQTARRFLVETMGVLDGLVAKLPAQAAV
jgi:DNA-binding transcriptional LysR family regulator